MSEGWQRTWQFQVRLPSPSKIPWINCTCQHCKQNFKPQSMLKDKNKKAAMLPPPPPPPPTQYLFLVGYLDIKRTERLWNLHWNSIRTSWIWVWPRFLGQKRASQEKPVLPTCLAMVMPSCVWHLPGPDKYSSTLLLALRKQMRHTCEEMSISI